MGYNAEPWFSLTKSTTAAVGLNLHAWAGTQHTASTLAAPAAPAALGHTARKHSQVTQLGSITRSVGTTTASQVTFLCSCSFFAFQV